MILSTMRNLTGSYALRPIALFATLVVLGCGGESGQAQSSDPPVTSSDAIQDAPYDNSQEMFDLSELGIDEGSLMTFAIGVVDFSDFGCIFCATFHVSDYPVLYDEFVSSGDILWKYVPISIGGFPNGDLAGVTGICADELGRAEAFARMRDHLFENRDEWLGATPSDAPGIFLSYAESLGLDLAAFRACFEGAAAADRLDRNNQMAQQVGVTATPTFIVQGTPVRGAPPLADFQQALRRLIDQVRSEPPTSAPD
jgi:protein-disulfide isomerase